MIIKQHNDNKQVWLVKYFFILEKKEEEKLKLDEMIFSSRIYYQMKINKQLILYKYQK
ncbi:hypothetical protein pb186bvf_009647 [Paramecium bursaria]